MIRMIFFDLSQLTNSVNIEQMINFTGSVEVGRKIGALAGKHIKPSLLELGGNAPAVVLDSADLKLAANNIVFGGMLHSGHICMSTARIVVVDSVADELVSELEAIVKGKLPRNMVQCSILAC